LQFTYRNNDQQKQIRMKATYQKNQRRLRLSPSRRNWKEVSSFTC